MIEDNTNHKPRWKYQKLQLLLDQGIDVDKYIAYDKYKEFNLKDTANNLKNKGYPIKLYRVIRIYAGKRHKYRVYRKVAAP